MTASTKLFYTEERYAEYDIDTIHEHFGHQIQVIGRYLRSDLGEYFEIEFMYL